MNCPKCGNYKTIHRVSCAFCTLCGWDSQKLVLEILEQIVKEKKEVTNV